MPARLAEAKAIQSLPENKQRQGLIADYAPGFQTSLHVVKSPMDGVRRPQYDNERDRRLTPYGEARLLEATRSEDRDYSITP